MLVAQKGIQTFVSAFNSRSIPRKGVPLQLMSSSTVVTPLVSTGVPDSPAAVALYAASGGRITQFSAFCSDPLEGNPRLILARMEAFRRDFGDGSELFPRVVNGDYRHFHRAVLGTIEQTRHLHTLI